MSEGASNDAAVIFSLVTFNFPLVTSDGVIFDPKVVAAPSQALGRSVGGY